MSKPRVAVSRDDVLEVLRARGGKPAGVGLLSGPSGGGGNFRKGVYPIVHALVDEGLVERVRSGNGWGYRLKDGASGPARMTDDLVERVARAICASVPGTGPVDEHFTPPDRPGAELWRTMATAAIRVMFDATKEFLDEVEKLDKSVWGDKDTREVAMALWRDDMALWKDEE